MSGISPLGSSSPARERWELSEEGRAAEVGTSSNGEPITCPMEYARALFNRLKKENSELRTRVQKLEEQHGDDGSASAEPTQKPQIPRPAITQTRPPPSINLTLPFDPKPQCKPMLQQFLVSREQKSPRDIQALFLRGVGPSDIESAARACLRKEKDPRCIAELNLYLCRSLIAQDNKPEAAQAVREGLAVATSPAPELIIPLIIEGEKLGMDAQLEVVLSAALRNEMQPHLRAELTTKLASVLEKLGRRAEAATVLRAEIERMSEEPTITVELTLTLAAVLERQNRSEEAERVVRDELERAQDSCHVYQLKIRLASILKRLGRASDAEEVLRAELAQTINPIRSARLKALLSEGDGISPDVLLGEVIAANLDRKRRADELAPPVLKSYRV